MIVNESKYDLGCPFCSPPLEIISKISVESNFVLDLQLLWMLILIYLPWLQWRIYHPGRKNSINYHFSSHPNNVDDIIEQEDLKKILKSNLKNVFIFNNVTLRSLIFCFMDRLEEVKLVHSMHWPDLYLGQSIEIESWNLMHQMIVGLIL